MSRLSIRARLTGAFALAMVAMLAAAGLFVYLELRADLDEAVEESLAGRADAVAAHAAEPGGVPPEEEGRAVDDPEEAFAQLVRPDGAVVDVSGGATQPALSPVEVRDASGGPVTVERPVAGIEGTARVLARPLLDSGPGAVLVVGQSLEDPEETLSGLVATFAVGAPVAVLLASAGLKPVDAMRRRAREVSLSQEGERLPVPVARDEVSRLGETLNEMLDRLQQSFERERRFVADASHELRTPIAVLKTEIEGALRAGRHRPEVRDALVAALDECDHLAQLADDLLMVARAAEGRLPVWPETLAVHPVLEGVRRRFADRAKARGREVEVDAPETLTVRADPDRMRQALGNLVDNALRHGEGDVVLRARAGDGSVPLDVSDHGPGFGREIAARAFERFARDDSARTRGGAGLGMAIVKAVAEAHGGSAELVPGPGARVRILLPETSSAPALSSPA